MTRSARVTGRTLRTASYRLATLALVVLATAGGLGVVVLSPVALARVPIGQGNDWTKLSDVGQAYGAASALLSVFALGGVAVSLYLQRRESKAAREQSLRGLHTDLLRMAMDERELLECWGPIGKSTDVSWYRQHIYLNLIVTHWQMMWEIGDLTESHLRLLAGDLFGGPLGRRYWSEAREARRVAEKGRRARSFHSIVDGEYQASLLHPDSGGNSDLAEIALDVVAVERPDGKARRGFTTAAVVAVGAVAGIAARQFIRRSTSGRGRLR